MKNDTLKQLTLGLLLGVLLGLGSYALTASNTVPDSQAGQGAQTISGYTVASVTYTLNSTDASQISAVTFDLTPVSGGGVATTVKARLTSAAAYSSCSRPDATNFPTRWSCNAADTARNAANLDVVAVQ